MDRAQRPTQIVLEGFNFQRATATKCISENRSTLEKGKKKLLGWAFQRLRASPTIHSALVL